MDSEKTKTIPTRETLLFCLKSDRRIVSDLDVEESKFTAEHESLIRRHYDQLLSNLSVPDVVTQMFKIGKLSARDHEHIRQFQSTPIKASEELLNIIISNPRYVYECFLESLKKTTQHHVYQMLTSDNESICIGGQFVSEHSRLIRLNYDWLTEKLDLVDSGLLPILYAKKVLSQREFAQLCCEKDRFVKNEGLLSAMSRKTAEDFNKFIVALNETLQGHIANRLKENKIGEACQNAVTTITKTWPIARSDKIEKRIPPKAPSKPNKKPPALPSIKPVVIKPKPLLKPKITSAQPNHIQKQQRVTTNKFMKKRSAEGLQAKFRVLPNELKTEVSTKMFLIHDKRKPTDSIWKITFTKILEDSHIKRELIEQAKAERQRLMQEINQRERECKLIKEDTEEEKTIAKTHIRQLQERVNELEDKLSLADSEKRNILLKLKKSEAEADNLKDLNIRQAQEGNEKSVIVEKLESQVAYSEMEAKLKDQELRETIKKLEENQEMLNATKVKLCKRQTLLFVREKSIDNLELLNEEVNETLGNVGIIDKLKDQLTHSKTALREAAERLRDAHDKLAERELALKETTAKLEEIQTNFKETETKSEGSRAKCLEIEQKLKEEQTEKDKYKRIIDELQDNYKSEPVLLHTIRTKFRKNNLLNIFRLPTRSKTWREKVDAAAFLGMTILDKELFVVCSNSPYVEVYDSINLSVSRTRTLKGLINPGDICACKRNKCLYIINVTDKGDSCEIFRIDPNGKLIKKWSTGDDIGCGLSVTGESNVILTMYCKLKEYSPDGQLVREITLPSDYSSLHAIKLTNGDFAISQTRDMFCYDTDEIGPDDFYYLNRVIRVDADGKLKKSSIEESGLDSPCHLVVDANEFVMVVDAYKIRVSLLDSDLIFKKELLSREKHGLRCPVRILLDESNGRLLVANSEMNNIQIMVFCFKYIYM